ncbi:MAG: hypothetical protein K2Y22_13165 [Candidatus Obscuribacterales bacterium]|nr:hypothetical protein [Candidatus Obscuribacterales bacterium]
MSNSIEAGWGRTNQAESVVAQSAREKLLEQTQANDNVGDAQSRKDAEAIAKSNPPDREAVSTLAEHLFEAYQLRGDNWSGQVGYAKKVNDELEKRGSKMRIVINTASRGFKDEMGPGEVGLFSIVDIDGSVILSRLRY